MEFVLLPDLAIRVFAVAPANYANRVDDGTQISVNSICREELDDARDYIDIHSLSCNCWSSVFLSG